MLGQHPQNTGAQTAETIFDVTAEDFETRVMAASMEKPVIVDFWAPWCGPCRQLMPLLESAVNAAGGEVLLAKVNLDENPELAQALRVQSVPTVFAFLGGRPVDAFQGVIPQSAIKDFIAKQVQTAKAARPGAVDIPETLKAGAQALAENDLQMAQGCFMQVLQQDDTNTEAFTGLIRTLIAAGQVEQAAAMAENAPEDITKDPGFAAARTAIELAQNTAPSGELKKLEEKAAKNLQDMEAQCALAEVQFASGKKEQAIETLLAAIAHDREWNEQEARKNLLRFFEALGHADPLTVAGRKKLSAILFS
ncbi:MAG: tetratricopeptide repeat protein [Alphaproteobacteria bacterium]